MAFTIHAAPGAIINNYDIHDCEVVNIDSIGKDAEQVDMHTEENEHILPEELATPEACTSTSLPKGLNTSEARAMLDKIVAAGWLTQQYQPAGISRTERSVLAHIVSSKLGISNCWSCFERLWKVKYLASDYQKALEMQKTQGIFDRILQMIE